MYLTDKERAARVEQIAKSVLPLYGKILERIAAHNAHVAKCRENLKEIWEAFGEGKANIENGQNALNIYRSQSGYATINAHADQFDLDLRNLPIPLALEIAATWKRYFDKQEK